MNRAALEGGAMSMYRLDDWELFRDLEGLLQKAGVSRDRLGALVVKELVDNALDEAGTCEVEELPTGGIAVADHGSGIPGDPEEVARLFSIGRPLTSSKMLRKPTRGRLGHGLRVVTGAVLASRGSLRVATRGRLFTLVPKDDGTTTVSSIERWKGRGTRIEVALGSSVPWESPLRWSDHAMALAQAGPTYRGRTSPYWYDSSAFFSICQAAGSTVVREFVTRLDGCAEPKAGKIAAPFRSRACESLTREEAEQLLARARHEARVVRPDRLGPVGRIPRMPATYVMNTGTFTLRPGQGSISAEIPFIVEVWADSGASSYATALVNRTPIVQEVRGHSEKRAFHLWGAGLRRAFDIGDKPCSVTFNITTPHVPLTSDGKAPDLSVFGQVLYPVVEKALRRARRRPGLSFDLLPAGPKVSVKEVIFESFPAAVAKASGDGSVRYNQRQLYYVMRPLVANALGVELDYKYFCQKVTEYESQDDELLSAMIRDARGTLYHPHLSTEIPLGTLAAEHYERPEWTFNKILYLEKEGFFPLLKNARWPERHDCALLTSKGFATRAVRDVLDRLADGDEDITIYCVHDADGEGTAIYEALQHATPARPGRAVKIINLGLEPDEADAMNLQFETIQPHKKRTPVARYVLPEWREWLQGRKVGRQWVGGRRVELNAMTTPQFLDWLDRKIAQHDPGKVVPPDEILEESLRSKLDEHVRRMLTQEILAKANLEGRVRESVERLAAKTETVVEQLEERVRRALRANPKDLWTVPVQAEAERLARAAMKRPRRGQAGAKATPKATKRK